MTLLANIYFGALDLAIVNPVNAHRSRRHSIIRYLRNTLTRALVVASIMKFLIIHTFLDDRHCTQAPLIFLGPRSKSIPPTPGPC